MVAFEIKSSSKEVTRDWGGKRPLFNACMTLPQNSLVAQTVKNPPAVQETWAQSLSWEDPLEKGMATHSSILAWRTPWTEEPGGLQSMGSQRVGHDEAAEHTCASARIQRTGSRIWSGEAVSHGRQGGTALGSRPPLDFQGKQWVLTSEAKALPGTA